MWQKESMGWGHECEQEERDQGHMGPQAIRTLGGSGYCLVGQYSLRNSHVGSFCSWESVVI